MLEIPGNISAGQTVSNQLCISQYSLTRFKVFTKQKKLNWMSITMRNLENPKDSWKLNSVSVKEAIRETIIKSLRPNDEVRTIFKI